MLGCAFCSCKSPCQHWANRSILLPFTPITESNSGTGSLLPTRGKLKLLVQCWVQNNSHQDVYHWSQYPPLILVNLGFHTEVFVQKKKKRKNLLHLSLLPTSSSFPDFQDSAIMQYLILNFCLNVNSCLCWLLIYSEVKLSSDNAFRDCRYFRRLSSICPRSWKMFFSFVEAS